MRFAFDLLFKKDVDSIPGHFAVSNTPDGVHGKMPASFKRLGDIQVDLNNACNGSVTLISREDIYSDQGRGPLLVRQGTEVHPDVLEKLLHCGVDPSQFYLKNSAQAATGNVMQNTDARKTVRNIRASLLANKHVVVLDANQKSLKRTIDALCQVGFQLGKIHPVRMSQYLAWTLGKYQPDVLVIDYQLAPGLTGLNVLQAHEEECAQLAQVIMTVSAGALDFTRQAEFFAHVEAMEVDVLFKPILAGTLENIIAESLISASTSQHMHHHK